jgi:hypothetical protein
MFALLKSAIRGSTGLAKVVIDQSTGIRIDIAEPEIIKNRRDICRICEYSTKYSQYIDTPSKGLCRLSRCRGGCNGMPVGVPVCFVEAKTKIKSETCPQQKW